MSIKQVTCPSCHASMNVMASMASAKCQSCGEVFSVNSPQGKTPPRQSGSKAPRSSHPAEASGTNNAAAWMIFGGVLLVAIVCIAVMTYALRGDQPTEDDSGVPVAIVDQETGDVRVVDQPAEDTPQEGVANYEIIDLPESTRKKIYRDYKAMIDSSFGKAKRIPKSGFAGQSLRSMLGGTVERELTRMALIYGIEPEDILQIVAEGEDKGW